MLIQTPDLGYRLQRKYRLTTLPLLTLDDVVIPVSIVDDARDADFGSLERFCTGNIPINAPAAGNVAIAAFIPQGGSGTTYLVDRIIAWTSGGVAGQLGLFIRNSMTGLSVTNETRWFTDRKVVGVPSANLQSRNDFPVGSLVEQDFLRQIRHAVNVIVQLWNVDEGDPPLILYAEDVGAVVDSLFIVNRTTTEDLHVEISWRERVQA